MSKRIVLALLAVAGCQGAASTTDPAAIGDVASLEQAATSAAGTTSTQNVKIVNATSDWLSPVPVTGNVQATQSGPWSMSLAPGAIVSVGNIPMMTLQEGTTVNVGSVYNPIAISSLPAVDVANLPPVSIANFPATQTVSGTVAISNLPASQTVSGTVAISNLPPTQAVTGTVAISNLPATQPVSGSVTISNLPATQAVSGTVDLAPTAKVTTTSADLTQVVFASPSIPFDPTNPIEIASPELDVSAYQRLRIWGLANCPSGYTTFIDVVSTAGGTNGIAFQLASTGQIMNQTIDLPGTIIKVKGYCRTNTSAAPPDNFQLAILGRR